MELDGSTGSNLDASTDITTVSPRRSSPDEMAYDECTTFPDSQEIFHTPPRYRSPSNSPSFYDCNDDGMIGGGLDHDGETGNVGSKRAADLGKDVEVDTPKRLKTLSDSKGTFHMESDGIMGIDLGKDVEVDTPKRLKTLSDSEGTFNMESEGFMGIDLGKDVEVDTPKRLKTLSDSEGTFHMESEGFMGIELPLGTGPKESNSVTQNNSIVEKSLDVSTEGIESNARNMKAECQNDNGEGNTNVVEDIDSAGNCSDSCGTEDRTEKSVLLPSLDPKADSGTEDEGFKLLEGIVDIETPREPKEENTETKNSSIEVGVKEQSCDCSTKGIECDTEIWKVECKNDGDERNSEKIFNILEDIDSAGSGSNLCEEKTKENDVLPSLVDEDPEANSRKREEGFMLIPLLEEIIDAESPSELLGSGPKQGNTETKNNSIEVSIKGTNFDSSTEGIEYDTENRKVECENDNAEASSEKNSNIVVDIDSVGNGSNSCGSEEEKTKKNVVLPSLPNAHPEANSRAGDVGLEKILLVEQFMDTESPSEPFGIGHEEGNVETENNSVEVSIMGKHLDVSTEAIECDIENRKVQCGNDIGDGNSEINRDIVEAIDAAGNGSNSCGSEQEKTKKNRVLPSLVDAHPEANSRAGDKGLKQISLVEGFMDIESPNEPLGIGPEEGNAEIENNSTEVSIKGKSLDVSTVGIECDTRKVDCGKDTGEGNSEINTNIVEEIDPAGNGSSPFGMEEEKTNKNSVFASLPGEHLEVNRREGDEGVQRILLSEVLRKLAKNEPEEDCLARLSLLEVAERRWGPF